MTTKSVSERYFSWAELTRRDFAIDVLWRPSCQAPMKILAQIHPPDTTRKILQRLGPPARLPPNETACPDPQECLPIAFDESEQLYSRQITPAACGNGT